MTADLSSTSNSSSQSALNATFFISDLHLDEAHPELTQAFHHFLFKIAVDASNIYILGDFFDAWIGDDNNSKLITQVKTWLNEKAALGTKIYFLHGNRDFLIGESFALGANVILLHQPEVIDLYGVNHLVLHGDELCTDDTDYQQFRKKVRDPAWQNKVLSYPLWLRKLIAKYLRHRSRKAHKYKSEAIMDVAQTTVESFLETHKVQDMIHGHTHRPDIHEWTRDGNDYRRFVLGDWGTTGWYIKADENGTELIEFPIKE